MELDLTEIRKDIDKIDEQLLELFKQRMTLTGDVARYKAKNNMVVFQGDREKAIIETSVTAMTATLNAVFFIFLSIFNPAERMRNTTHACVPRKADATHGIIRNRSKKSDIRYIITNDGRHIPTVPTRAPRKPCRLYPI